MRGKPLAGGGAENPYTSVDERGRTETKEQQRDLNDFLRRAEQMSSAEKQTFLDKAGKWNHQQQSDELRKAGVSAEEDEKDFTAKNVMLAAAFLERAKETPQMRFKVDFKGNQLAEYKVGAGNLLPPNVSAIKIYNETGNVVCARAFRGIDPVTGRIGYFDEAAFKETGRYDYIPVFTGFEIEILETLETENAIVQRRILSEHVGNYQSRPRGPIENYAPAGLPVGRLETAAENRNGSVNRQPPRGLSVEQNLAALGEEMANLRIMPEIRARIASIARTYAGAPREEFRTGEVEGGRLACAKVVSTILQEAGFLDKTIWGVDATVSELLSRGWTYSQDKPEAGDVVVWAPVSKPTAETVDDAPAAQKGHKHIGIVTGPNAAVSNSSIKGMPVQHAIYTGRPVEAILKPPAMSASPQKTESVPAQRPAQNAVQNPPQRPAESPVTQTHGMEKLMYESALNPKLNAEIENKLEAYGSLIAAASEKYGVPANLIKAVIFQESGGDAMICSPVGAGGLMQLMPGTAGDLGMTEIYPVIVGTSAKGKTIYRLDPRDERANPGKNIDAGTRLLARLLQKFNGDVQLSLASYNWGEGNVAKYLAGKRKMPLETAGYIDKIPKMYASLEKAGHASQSPIPSQEAAPERGGTAIA
jgi:hypothetical protein